MNYMKQVADMLGVELEQEFKLKGISKVFKITKDGMYMKTALTNQDYLLQGEYIAIGSILIGDHEVKKPILNEVEKEYLSALIKPFRDIVISIGKCNCYEYEYIVIKYLDYGKYEGHIYLPCFKRGTMYKGMEAGKEYSLGDLRL